MIPEQEGHSNRCSGQQYDSCGTGSSDLTKPQCNRADQTTKTSKRDNGQKPLRSFKDGIAGVLQYSLDQ